MNQESDEMPTPPATTDEAPTEAATASVSSRANVPRHSGKRVTAIFALILATILGCALVAFLLERTPDGPVLAMVAMDDHQAVVLRADPRRGHTYLTVETAEATSRSLALFGVPPGATPLLRDGLITVPITGARGAHEVNAFQLDNFHFVYGGGQPDPETSPPDPAHLPLTLGEGEFEVALYGEPLSQAVVFRRADGQPAFRAAIPPLGDAPPQVWPTPSGFVLFDGRGVARSYDRRHDLAGRPPRDPQPVGGPGASFCAVDEGWLFLTRAGSLNRLPVSGAPQRLADGFPTDLGLLGCGRRGEARVLLLGDTAHQGVELVLELTADGHPGAKVQLGTGEAQGPRLERVGEFPRFLALVDGAGALRVVDLDRFAVEDAAQPCAGVRRLLITPEGSFAGRTDALVRVDGATGALRTLVMPGLDGMRTPRSGQLSDHNLFVPAGSGFAVLSRVDMTVIGSRALELGPATEGCGGAGTP